jgi:hypothetical protein
MRLEVALIVLIPDLRRVLSKFRYLTPNRCLVADFPSPSTGS